MSSFLRVCAISLYTTSNYETLQHCNTELRVLLPALPFPGVGVSNDPKPQKLVFHLTDRIGVTYHITMATATRVHLKPDRMSASVAAHRHGSRFDIANRLER
jgi:hypothetical protein